MRVFILLLPLTFFISSVSAQPLAVTHTFSNTTIADADQVNQNFAEIEAWVNAYLAVGEANTALGLGALSDDTTGIANTAIGYRALESNTTGSYNTAIGDRALLGNSTGSQNTATGYSALYSNTSGRFNTATGYEALESNTSGAYNTASGYQALYNNTNGARNAALGHQALYSNTSGDYNTATGRQALYSNTTGAYNTAIGWFSDVTEGDFLNATAIGYRAIVNSSNKIQLGNTDVTSVSTAGALTTGEVTYPNEDGFSGQVLATNGSGVVDWVDGLPTGCSEGEVPLWNGFGWQCSANSYTQRSEELEERVASLQKLLQDQKEKSEGLREELLAVVQSQQEQMAAQQVQMATQQEQIAQLQRMVEHQFAAR